MLLSASCHSPTQLEQYYGWQYQTVESFTPLTLETVEAAWCMSLEGTVAILGNQDELALIELKNKQNKMSC